MRILTRGPNVKYGRGRVSKKYRGQSVSLLGRLVGGDKLDGGRDNGVKVRRGR